jgi:hypothetical protein
MERQSVSGFRTHLPPSLDLLTLLNTLTVLIAEGEGTKESS